jgi:hypothetical protein
MNAVVDLSVEKAAPSTSVNLIAINDTNPYALRYINGIATDINDPRPLAVT